MSSRNHVVITGTGRAGTTFLVELLTHLGLETGFRVDELASGKREESSAGLEHDIRKENCPYIVKSPWFCDNAEEITGRDDIVIDRILIPVRDLHAAAESRRRVSRANVSKLPLVKQLKNRIRPKKFAGGLWHTQSMKPGDQEQVAMEQIYRLIFAISDTNIPVTFMRFPRIVKDSAYLFEKLQPIIPDITYEQFSTLFNETAQLDLVHSFNKKDI